MSKGRPFDVTDMNDPSTIRPTTSTHPFYEPDKVGPGRPAQTIPVAERLFVALAEGPAKEAADHRPRSEEGDGGRA